MVLQMTSEGVADHVTRGPDQRSATNSKDGVSVEVTSIFNRSNKDNGQVRVPSIEVRGDELRVDDNNNQDRQPDEKSYRLPKTKWF